MFMQWKMLYVCSLRSYYMFFFPILTINIYNFSSNTNSMSCPCLGHALPVVSSCILCLSPCIWSLTHFRVHPPRSALAPHLSRCLCVCLCDRPPVFLTSLYSTLCLLCMSLCPSSILFVSLPHPIPFFKTVTVFNIFKTFVCWRGSFRERQWARRRTELIFHLLVQSPNGHKGQGQDRLKPGATNSLLWLPHDRQGALSL